MLVRAVFVLFCLQVADFSEPACIIELHCVECVPDNPPLVTSHRAANGSVSVAAGEVVELSCGGGKFLLYPLDGALAAVCERGRWRVRRDGALRHLLDLGCQENVFEDVLHHVDHCGSPYQGRAYQTQGAAAGAGARHLATVCFDEDRAAPRWLRAGGGLPLPPHRDRAAPLSLLGNFNHMFDARTRREAERLYADDASLTRRLRALLRPRRCALAGQALAAAPLLPDEYFADQDARVADFASNKVASWGAVVAGNLRHLHRDVGALLRRGGRGGDIEVYAGTHGVLALHADGAPAEVHLKAGGRFPVPRYLWTAVVARGAGRGLALVLLNDPFVTVSAIREAVFCESACSAAPWLEHLLENRNYERPLLGLVFCCELPEFAARVPEMPRVFNDTIKPLV